MRDVQFLVVEILADQLALLASDPVDDEELDRGIGQVCGGLVLGLEDSSSRMSRLGRAELTLGQFTTIEENLAQIQAVTADDVRSLASELASQPRHLVIVGPGEDDVAARLLPTL